MINNKKVSVKILLLIIILLVLASTQTLAASVARITGLKTQSISETKVTISWNKLTNVTGYQIYVKEDGGTYKHIGNTTSTQVSITNLQEGETYSLKVRGYQTTNGSTSYGSFSTEITFTTKGTSSSEDTSTTVDKATNLKLRAVTETTAKFTWTKSSNATGYEVYLKEVGGTYQNIGKVTSTNLTVTGLAEGTTYYIKIRAYRTVNGTTTYATAYSNEVKFTTKGTSSSEDTSTTVDKATNLKLSAVTETTAKFTWTKSSNATGYEVYLKEVGGTYQNIGKVTSTNLTVTGLAEGTTYYIKIRAYRTVNGTTTYATAYSNEVKFTTKGTSSSEDTSTTVDKATNLKLSTVTETTAKFTWTKSSNATGYEVYLKEVGGTYQNIGKVTSTNLTVTGLAEGTTYYIKIRAYRTVNGTTTYATAYSNEVKFTTKGTSSSEDTSTTVDKATNLKLRAVTETTAKFTWTKSSNATGYEVYLKEVGGTYQNIGKVTSTNLTVTGLAEGTTYYIKIRAYRTVNGTTTYATAYSNEVKFTTKETNTEGDSTLGKVTNLKLVNLTKTTAKFTWDTVANATAYEVYIRNATGSYRKVGTSTNTNVTITGLTEGTTYYVKIRAIKIENGTTTYATEYSNEYKFVTDGEEEITKPNQVTNLKTKNITATTTDLMWNRVPDANGYEIYLRTAGTGYSSQGITSNTYATLRDLTANTTYYAKVRAYKVVNGTTVYGDFSTEISFTTAKGSTDTNPDETIAKVLNLKAETTTTQAKLTWDSVANVDGYEIYVNNQGRGYQSLGKTTNNSVTLIGLSAGKTYNIKVRAYKVVKGTTTYGEFSDELTITAPKEETLGKVTNLQATLSSKQAKLTWDDVSTAAGYEVYIKLPGQGYKSLGTVANRDNVRIVNLATGSSYSVKVRAYKVVNGTTIYGEFSDEVTFTAE